MKACSACVSRVGAGEVSPIKSSSITGVHFSLDSGPSYFGASPGQLGSDQKPQAEETQARRLSAEGATRRHALCRARPEGTAAARPPASPARGARRARRPPNCPAPTPPSPASHAPPAAPPRPPSTLLSPQKGTNPSLRAGQEKSQWVGRFLHTLLFKSFIHDVPRDQN